MKESRLTGVGWNGEAATLEKVVWGVFSDGGSLKGVIPTYFYERNCFVCICGRNTAHFHLFIVFYSWFKQYLFLLMCYWFNSYGRHEWAIQAWFMGRQEITRVIVLLQRKCRVLFMTGRSGKASLRKWPLSTEAGVSQINVDKGTERGKFTSRRVTVQPCFTDDFQLCHLSNLLMAKKQHHSIIFPCLSLAEVQMHKETI